MNDLRLCICTMIKDEQHYIEEWIEYHHNLGFDKFYLIEDYNSSSHADTLNKYDYVELHRMGGEICNDEELSMLQNGTYRLKIAYHIFNRLWRHKNDWMAFIDVDEFIDLDKQTLISILKDSYNKPLITMKWKNMECNNHIEHPNNWNKYSLIETYTDFNDYIYNVKQILNCKEQFDDYLQLSNWRPLPHKLSGEKNNFEHNIYLKHFLCKSFEEFVYRLSHKGEMIDAGWNRKIDDWFITNSKFLDDKEQIINKYIDKDFKIKTNDYVL